MGDISPGGVRIPLHVEGWEVNDISWKQKGKGPEAFMPEISSKEFNAPTLVET